MMHRSGAYRLVLLTAFVTVTLLFAAAVSLAHGGCVAVYSSAMMKRLPRGSTSRVSLPSNITTESQCKSHIRSVWPSASSWEINQVSCQCSGSSGGGGLDGFYVPDGATPGQALTLGILGAALNSALSPPAGPSPEEIAHKQAVEEAARIRAAEEARRRAVVETRRQEAELKRRMILAAQMKGVDGGSASSGNASTGRRLTWKKIDADMTPPSAISPGSGSVAAGMSTFGRLSCAQALSDAAAQYASMGSQGAEQARFYAEQAQKALAGERLEVQCPAVALPAVPEPPEPERVYPGESTIAELEEKVKIDLDFLDAVRVRKQELSERKTVVEAKKKEAEEKISNPPAPVLEGEPTPDTDALMAEAEALLRESEAELAEITKYAEGLEQEEARLNDNLKRYQDTENRLKAEQTTNP